ncbi:MAG: DinB family protein [Acidobacteria bacterium]|nr:DinB family protein [Acidobacteriota bacterium]
MNLKEPDQPVLFLERWRLVRKRTIGFLKEIPERDRTGLAWEGGRSVVETVAHLIATQDAVLRGLSTDAFTFDESESMAAREDWEGLLAKGRELDRDLVELLDSVSSEWWTSVSAHGLTRGEWLWQMLEHEIHHRAQIPVIIRIAGGVPPRIYP